jgi:hypothetical protein
MQTAMPLRERFCVYAVPNVIGPAGFAMAETAALRSGMARKACANGAAILAKRNTPFSSSTINALHAGVAAGRWNGCNSPFRGAAPMRGRRHVRPIARLARRGAILCSGEKSLLGQEEFPVFRRNRESAASC